MSEQRHNRAGLEADALEEAATHRGQALIDVNVDPKTLNLKRFSLGPAQEVVLDWWDHRVTYSVRREHSGHQVLVNEDVSVQWKWHVVIGVLVAVGITGGSLVFGMPILYSLLLGVLLGLIVIGLIIYERSISEDSLDELYRSTTKIDGSSVLVLDEPVWEDVKGVIASVYDKAVDKADKVEQRRFGGPSWLRRFRPIPSAAMSGVLAEMHLQLEQVRLSRYHRTLRRHYENHKDTAVELGRGTRDCQCQACLVIAEQQWSNDVSVSGSVKALERARGRIAVGTGVQWETSAMVQAEHKRAQAKADVLEKRRSERVEREKKRHRREVSKAYVAQRRKDKAEKRREARRDRR